MVVVDLPPSSRGRGWVGEENGHAMAGGWVCICSNIGVSFCSPRFSSGVGDFLNLCKGNSGRACHIQKTRLSLSCLFNNKVPATCAGKQHTPWAAGGAREPEMRMRHLQILGSERRYRFVPTPHCWHFYVLATFCWLLGYSSVWVHDILGFGLLTDWMINRHHEIYLHCIHNHSTILHKNRISQNLWLELYSDFNKK